MAAAAGDADEADGKSMPSTEAALPEILRVAGGA